jgi:tetratricopeptide (TPR) repeat protein
MEGKKDEAIDLQQKGFEKSQDPTLGIELASNKGKAGKADEAIKIYERILEKYPNHILAANNLAMMLLNGEPDQQLLDRAMALVSKYGTSNNPIVLDTLGWAHIKRGEYDKAISVLSRALNKESKLPEIDYHIAVAYHNSGKQDKAKEHLEAALSTEKDFEGIDDAQELMEKLKN